ncbi:MAG: hypothetical protein BGO95_03955 [Micrococcales bacterium 73-13]|nr:MAG: hypothetical protein BGO95_03955 [Micrococcales bacterium 73-13]
MKVLFWSPGLAHRQILDLLDPIDGIEVELVSGIDEFLGSLPDADFAILTDQPEAEARRILDAIERTAPRLIGMHFVSAGREGFDTVGIPGRLRVSGAAGASAPTVAEHAVALILAVGRQLAGSVLNQHAHIWDRAVGAQVRSLEGQTVLIVGHGAIGQAVGARVQSFGARVVGLQRRPRPAAGADELGSIADLDRYLPDADVVVLTAALVPETRSLIDATRIAALKPTALVVNVSRGGLMDHEALADALRAGRIWGAGLDVTEPEPLPADHPLWDAPNTIISPHYGLGGSPQTIQRIARGAADAVIAALGSLGEASTSA